MTNLLDEMAGQTTSSEDRHECSKGWGSRCASAKGTRCECKCGGHNHGTARHGSGDATARSHAGSIDDSSITSPLFDQFEEQALAHKNTCRWCEAKLVGPVQGYPHDGGWTVPGMGGKWWLYIKCPKCQYDWSLQKLGVPRE